MGNVESWETTIVKAEYDGVNPISIRMLERDFKYIYTFIKKQKSVRATDIFSRFQKMDVENILYDLRDMYLVYFVREVK